MSRSHPPTLLTLARRTLEKEILLASKETVLVAVSGGPDSMALLHVLACLQKKFGLRIVAHGIDHGLRPGASAELDLAERLAATLSVPFARTRLHVAAGGNLQARARSARFSALRQAAHEHGAGVLATAHHANDRAETVLLRLLRGAGPQGLAVLPAKASWPAVHEDAESGTADAAPELYLVRPLIRASRSDIDAHIARHALPFAVDPSNTNPRFLRTRVRHEVLPLLQELSPSIVEHLCALADQNATLDGGDSVLPHTRLPSSSRPPSGHPTLAHMRPLSRATRHALTSLAQTRSEKGHVRLPGGLVASYDQTQLAIVVRGSDKRR